MSQDVWKHRLMAGRLWMLVVVLGLVIAALVSERFWHDRMDFTAGQQYTLTPVTIEMLRGLDDQVSVRAVFSEDLPARFAQLKTHVQDLLLEFEGESQGKVKVRFEDPGLDSAARAATVREGVQEIQVTEQNRGGAVAKRGFFGLVLSYGTKQEVIPLIQSLESFEYDLVVAIRQLTGGRKKLVVVEGTGADKLMYMDPTSQSPQDGFMKVYPSLYEELKGLYDVQIWDGTNPIASDAAMVLVAAPRNLNPSEQYWLDQFLMQGRNALVLAPSVRLDFGRGIQAVPEPANWLPWLAHLGFEVQTDLVMDERHGTAFFGGNTLFGTPYPYFVQITEQDLNRENAITSKLGSVMLPWTSSLKLSNSPQDSVDSVSTVRLLQTSPKGWVVNPPFNLQPQPQYFSMQQQVVDLVALRRGYFSSMYDSIPAGVDAQGRPHLKRSVTQAGVLVVPNSLFATDFFVKWSSQGLGGQSTVENIALVLNAVDFMALDPSLIQIRNREVINRPITEAGFAKRHFWIAFNLLFVPVLLGLIGLVVLWRRRKGGNRS